MIGSVIMRIEINDLLLFKYLFEENYIHIDDVLNFNLMKHKSESSKRYRLSQLKKAGYIKYKADPFSRKHYIFPTEKTKVAMKAKFDEFKKEYKIRNNTYLKFYKPKNYSIKQDFNFNNLIHDRELTQLRFYLEEIGVDYWQRETMYYNKYTKNPDSIFQIAKNNFAVELEKNYKDLSRYENIFIKYYKMKEIKLKAVIYVTTDDDVYNQLNNLLKDIFIGEISDKVWQNKIRIAKFDNFKNGLFKTFIPYEQEIKDSTKIMTKYRRKKKGE